MKNFTNKSYNFNANSIEGFNVLNDNFNWLSVYNDKRAKEIRETPLFALFIHRLSNFDTIWNAKQSFGINFRYQTEQLKMEPSAFIKQITPFLSRHDIDELQLRSTPDLTNQKVSSKIKRKRRETIEAVKEAGLQLKKEWKFFKTSLNRKQERQAILKIKKQLKDALDKKQESYTFLRKIFRKNSGLSILIDNPAGYMPFHEYWKEHLQKAPSKIKKIDLSIKFFVFLENELARISLLENNQDDISEYIHDLFVSQYIYTSYQLYQAREDIYKFTEQYKESKNEKNPTTPFEKALYDPNTRYYFNKVYNTLHKFSLARRSPIGIWLETLSRIKLDYKKRLNIIFNTELDTSKNYDDFILRLPKHIKKSLYAHFTINKISGKVREICAPKRKLKRLQRELLFFINLFYKPNSNIHGFTQNRSIISNAKIHKNKRYVLNVDIQDFFTTINFGRVRAIFQLSPFNFSIEEAHVIANACTLNGVLPQGSPTSPVISNLVSQRLDSKLRILAREYRCKYTRYGDDLTFSSNNELFNEKGYLKLLRRLTEEINKEGFRVNEDKTRFQTNLDRQSVTGLIVNRKVNISRRYLRTIRAMLNNWEKHGLAREQRAFEFYTSKSRSVERNKLIRKQNSIKNKDGKPNYSFLASLAGRIEFMGSVRGKNDKLYKKYNQQYIGLYSKAKSAKIRTSDIILGRFYEDTINLLESSKKNSPLDLQRALKLFRSQSHPFKYLLHPLSADCKYRGNDDSFLYNELRSDCIQEIDNLKIKGVISGDIISLISSYINASDRPDPIHEYKINEKYNIQNGWYSADLQRIIEKTKKHPLDTKIVDSLNEDEISVIKDFKDSVKAFNAAVRFDHVSFKSMINKINKKHGNKFGIEYFYEDSEDYLVSNGIFYDSYRFESVIRNLVFRNQYIKDGKKLIIRMDQEEYDENTKTTKINVKIRQAGAKPKKASGSFMQDGGDTNNYIADLRNLCDFSIQAKYTDGEYKIDYLSHIEKDRKKSHITRESSEDYVEFIFSFYTENKWGSENKLKKTMEVIKEYENLVKRKNLNVSEICLLDDQLLNHSEQNIKQLKNRYEKYINDFLAICQSHNEIKDDFSNFKCVMIHSSYQPLKEFDTIKNLCAMNKILFVQFGGGETESGKINEHYYRISAGLLFDNLESFLSYYDKKRVLNPKLLLE